MSELRIAIRESATELSREQTDQVAGGAGIGVITNNGTTCSADMTTDCWIKGGNFRFNDDIGSGA